MKNCEYAFRKNGDVSLHCRLLETDKNGDWCAHQYMCNQTKKWEVSQQGRTCRVKNKTKT